MKYSKLFLISFVLLFFIVSAVNALDASEITLNADNSIDEISNEDMGILNEVSPSNDIKHIYVNDTGDDSNIGSINSPYSSISKAIGDVNSSTNTTIYLSKGTFGKNNDTNFQFTNEINTYFDNCNVTFIGEGTDKTFIDGKSTYKFMTILEITPNLVFKDITFVNFRGRGSSVFELLEAGNLTIDNCVFKDSYSTSNGDTISSSNSGDLKIINSQFINSNGGIISLLYEDVSPGTLYLENNTFVNITNSENNGIAVTSNYAKAVIKNNKFNNITCINQNQVTLYLEAPDEGTLVLTDNNFVNCECLNEYFMAPVYLWAYEEYVIFERNIFLNSTGASGFNILLNGRMDNLNISIGADEINVHNNEINHGVNIPINITDDVGNLVLINSGIQLNLIGDNNNYTPYLSLKNKKLTFATVPESGIYNVTITYNDGLSTTEVLTIIKINISSSPVNIWVSPKGSDSNNGSEENPFKTIQHAIDTGFEKSFNVIIYLDEGIYYGESNVNLIITNKGSLQIIGKKYNKTIIDGEHSNWFLSVDTCDVEVKNLKFINGAGNKNLISGSNLLNLKDCIVDSNIASRNCYVLHQTLFDNLTYTNNTGTIYYNYNRNITKSNFINNKNIYDSTGIIYSSWAPIIILDCKFINNTALYDYGVIYSNNNIMSLNNYYYGNKAKNYGIFYASSYSSNKMILINDTYINNHVDGSYGIGISPYSSVVNCKFINNSAGTDAGIGSITITCSFKNCSFINNSATKGGVFVLNAVQHALGTTYEELISFDNVTFENNKASMGADIYLPPRSSNSYYSYTYPIELTITFDNITVTSLTDNLTASVYGVNGIIVGGAILEFYLNELYIGSSQIVNSNAILEYDGFSNGKAIVNGNIIHPSVKNNINNATLDIKLDNVLNHIDFWVSNIGSDENGDGSKTKPFKTIQYAVNKAFENCRDITIYLGEETYSGENNTNLTISSASNITIIGKGIGKTIINGGNSSYFVKILIGINKIIISDLTIINMTPDNRFDLPIGSTSPSGIHSIIKSGSTSPITVDKGATLYLNNVNITECRGGNAIIDGEGNIFIDNSILYKNGVSKGIIKCENLVINNSIIDKHLVGGYPIIGTNIIINNTKITDVFNIIRNGFYFISNAKNTTIENTCVLINNWENPLNILDIIEYYDTQICPAACIASTNAIIKNSSFKNEFELVYLWQSTTDYSYHNVYSGSNIEAVNSSFEGYQFIIYSRMLQNPIYKFDGCTFNNIANLMIMMQSRNSIVSFSNSVMFISGNKIASNNAFNNSFLFNNNYWGNNSKPVIPNSVSNFQIPSPDNWIILISEGEEPVFKLTDGKNVTEYICNLPAKISYVADENGEIIPVLNLNGNGYKFNVDENGNVVLNISAPMKNIVPKVPVDETVFANDIEVIVNSSSNFKAKFTNKWGDSLKGINVSFIIGENIINIITNENGTAILPVDFDLGVYFVKIVNPVTGQFIFKTIDVILENTVTANDIIVKYNDKSKFSVIFTDKFGNPLINTNVKFKVGKYIINRTTDENGIASFVINFNVGNYAVNTINPVTNQSIDKIITVNKIATKLTSPKLTVTYNAGKYLTLILKDFNGKALINQKVSIKINGKVYTKITNSKGRSSLKINLPVKTYITTLTYAGDRNHIKSSATTKVIVKKATPKMTAKKATFKLKTKTKKYSIILKDNRYKVMKKVKVYLKVKGKTYRAITNSKGKATFKITKLTKKGKYSARIKYSGNKYFNSITKYVKITIKR
ncbi:MULTISPECIES: hypothetical protein [Methanobrevibacter]|uniref:Adhesin-like protein n=1 Tax=Methanobrevibacter gottschalkii DSM 11977 TaxID=1122229 RepID=A0A3N5BTD1_9EURY|nr:MULTISPECIES: hypothetical protein [Methanobrevibacter]OEC99218.1 hypothetical protein A9505_04100 [Methanobrevibacter sp. A27]RPF53018.1 hypothetical protein EDC42_0584 [Methanobrevibacter gottschalkii DSM 11977]